MSVNRDVLPDDELVGLIVDAYRSESFTVSLDQITSRQRVPARRGRYLLIGLGTVAGVAVTAVVVIITAVLSGFMAFGGVDVEPATSNSPSGDPGVKPPRPSTSATDDGQRCADIAAQELTPISLPPQRFALDGPEPLRVRLYGDGEQLVVCWLNHDRVDIGGPSVIIDPSSSDYTMQAYGVGLFDPAYFPGPAEVAFGVASPGSTAVEIRFASGEPVQAELVDGWWAHLGIGPQRLDQAIELVMTTPAGQIVEPVLHG
jgi:hypothetical protein